MATSDSDHCCEGSWVGWGDWCQILIITLPKTVVGRGRRSSYSRSSGEWSEHARNHINASQQVLTPTGIEDPRRSTILAPGIILRRNRKCVNAESASSRRNRMALLDASFDAMISTNLGRPLPPNHVSLYEFHFLSFHLPSLT